MEAGELKVGDIVKMGNNRSDYFCDALGEVVEIVPGQEKSIGVRLHSELSHLFSRPLEEQILFFSPDDFVNILSEWPLEVQARRLFKKNWIVLSELNEPFTVERLCMVDGCLENRERRCLVNIWGNVCQVDVCDGHAQDYHGKCIDSFPFRES